MKRTRIHLPPEPRLPPTRFDRLCGRVATAGVFVILSPALFVAWLWKMVKGTRR